MLVQNRSVFKQIAKMMEFPKLDLPMHASFPRGDYSLYDCHSKSTYLILWFLSIEPPIYAILNEAIRIRDMKLLPMVGPLVAGLTIILSTCEKYRVDAMIPGYETLKMDPDHDLGSFSGSFLLFAGAQMKTNWIEPWSELVGKMQRPSDKSSTVPLNVFLQTNHHTTFSLKAALNHAFLSNQN